MEPIVSYGAREPTTAMEWRQEQTEAMYADENQWLQSHLAAERFMEAPMDRREKLLKKIDALAAALRELPQSAVEGIISADVEWGSDTLGECNLPLVHLTNDAFAKLNPPSCCVIEWNDDLNARHCDINCVKVMCLEPRA